MLMTNNPHVTAILGDPASFTYPITLRNGEQVIFRPLQKEDAQRLGDYFIGLSEDLRNRFAPHAFNLETAQELCDQVGESDTVRLIALREATQEVIAYYLLEFALDESDHQRYLDYGIRLDPASDCRFAPSVMDRFQHSGLGSALMASCKEMANRVGCQRMILMGGVYSWNEKAVPYYEKSGFRKVGIFRAGTAEESYDMILNLSTK